MPFNVRLKYFDNWVQGVHEIKQKHHVMELWSFWSQVLLIINIFFYVYWDDIRRLIRFNCTICTQLDFHIICLNIWHLYNIHLYIMWFKYYKINVESKHFSKSQPKQNYISTIILLIEFLVILCILMISASFARKSQMFTY